MKFSIRKCAIFIAIISLLITAWFCFQPYTGRFLNDIPEFSFIPRPLEYLNGEIELSERPDGVSKEIADSALSGVYSIQPRGSEILFPEVNIGLDSLWSYNGINNDSWNYCLQSLFILYDLINAHSIKPDPEYVSAGMKIIGSWIKNNPPGDNGNRLSWNDHTAANRVIAFCSFLDYLYSRDLLDDSMEMPMARLLTDHAIFLADHLNYKYANNHGIFQDYALLVATTHLDSTELSEKWVQLAGRRLRDQIMNTYSRESIHLENSPFYHFEITGLLARILKYYRAVGVSPPEILPGTTAEAEKAYSSFMMPDGNVVPVGDSPRDYSIPVPGNFVSTSGLTVYPDVGYAVIRGPFYLFFTASGKLRTHKHRDDLSFVLADSAGELIADVGFLSYSDSPENRYSVTWQGHNTISETDTYLEYYTTKDYSKKTGIISWGQGDNKSFIQGESERRSGFTQLRRLYCDLSLNLIVIIDEVSNNDDSEYYKYLHMPEPGMTAIRDDFVCTIRDSILISFWPELGKLSVIRGQENPLQGWMAIPNRGLRASDALEHVIPGNIPNSAVCIANDSLEASIVALNDSMAIVSGRGFEKKIYFSDSILLDSTYIFGEADTLFSADKIALKKNEYLNSRPRTGRAGLPMSLESRLMLFGAVVFGWMVVLVLMFIYWNRFKPIMILIVVAAFAINVFILYSILDKL